MIAALAKLELANFKISSESLQQATGSGGQIQVVIADGLEVAIPMAGQTQLEPLPNSKSRVTAILLSRFCKIKELICDSGLFDAEKEIARLEKQREKMEGELQNANARLSNESFASKAPSHVVDSFRNQRASAEQKLKLIAEKTEQMKQLL